MRGGNSEHQPDTLKRLGSSPLARGKSSSFFLISFPLGFIPACAGEIFYRDRDALRNRVHPRLRGGNYRCGAYGQKMTGSSPLARGKFVFLCGAAAVLRFIPACAGEILEKWRKYVSLDFNHTFFVQFYKYFRCCLCICECSVRYILFYMIVVSNILKLISCQSLFLCLYQF